MEILSIADRAGLYGQGAAAWLACSLCIGVAGTAIAQPAAPDARAAGPTPIATSSAKSPTAQAAVRSSGRAAWMDLTSDQRMALQPLAASWPTLNETQQLKWMAISRNFHGLTAPEQAKLQQRMSEWVALTRKQREDARLNYARTSTLAPDEKKARWEAYQALPDEERRKLASINTRPPSTATAVKPVPPQRLAKLPQPAAPTIDHAGPRIGVPAAQVDHNTLLPQQQVSVPQPLPMPSATP